MKTVGDVAKKSVNSKFKLGASSLKSLKSMFSASCMAGYIVNKRDNTSSAEFTDNF